MFKLNRVTRVFRNADNGNGNQSAFQSGSSPFQQSGNNVFDQMVKNKNPSNTTDNMKAPQMTNGMPDGSNNIPNQQGQQQGQQSNPQQAPNQKQRVSPLDKYNKKNDNDNSGGQQQQQQATPTKEPQAPQSIYDTDIKGWQGAMKNVDLAEGVTPELMQKATGGDANALMEIIQQVSRTAMTNAAHMSLKASGSGHKAGLEEYGKTIPSMINDHKFENMWQGDDVMKHSSAQPVVAALTAQLRSQYPQATPAEIQQEVQEQLVELGGAFGNKQQDSTNEPEVTDTSMIDFFS